MDRVLQTYIRVFAALFSDENGRLDGDRAFRQNAPCAESVLQDIREQICAVQRDDAQTDDAAVCDVVCRAVQRSGKLVNRQVRESFLRRCPKRSRDYAALFRALFSGAPDDQVFPQAVATLGANYDLIAFLFAVRPSGFFTEYGEEIPYLPMRPARMENCLALFGMPLRLAKQCSWDNYVQYLMTVRQIRDALCASIGDRTERAITEYDAITFLWMTETLQQTIEEEEQVASMKAQRALSVTAPTGKTPPDDHAPVPKITGAWQTNAILPPRDASIAEAALRRACGQCDADVRHRTFIRKQTDTPFLIPHHLIPLCYADAFDCSLDHPANIVSLCSHCHDLIHYGRDAALLLTKLYDKRADALEDAGIGISCAELLRMYGVT